MALFWARPLAADKWMKPVFQYHVTTTFDIHTVYSILSWKITIQVHEIRNKIEDQNIRLTSTSRSEAIQDYNRVTSVQESSQEERNSVIHEFSRTLKKWLSCLHHIISCSPEILAKGALLEKILMGGGARFRSWTRTHSVRFCPLPSPFFS